MASRFLNGVALLVGYLSYRLVSAADGLAAPTLTLTPSAMPTSFEVAIVNPKFDTPAEASDTYNYITDLSVISGWSFSGTARTMITNQMNAFNDIAFPTGTTQALTIQMVSDLGLYTATQSIALIPGMYEVAFYARPRPDNRYYSVGQTITATLNDATVTTSLLQSDDWVLYSFFTAITTAGVYPLTFSFKTLNTDCTTSISGILGTDTAISLTGISVVQSVVTATPSLQPTLPSASPSSHAPVTLTSTSPTPTLTPSAMPTSFEVAIVNPKFDTPALPSDSYNYITDLSVISGWSFSGSALGGTIITNQANRFNGHNNCWRISLDVQLQLYGLRQVSIRNPQL